MSVTTASQKRHRGRTRRGRSFGPAICCIRCVCFALWRAGTYRDLQMTAPPPRIELLGTFRVTSGHRILSLGASEQRVLALLALRGQPMTRERVAGTLWPDADRQTAQARLRTALWRMGSERSWFLASDGEHIGLRDLCDVDLHWAESVGHAVTAGESFPEQDGVLLDLFSRDLLPDWDEPWVTMDREYYREVRVRALEALAAAFLHRENHLQAIRACLYAIRCSPFRDSAHRLLVQVYMAEGNSSDAMRHILSYRESVRHELSLRPDDVLADMVEDLVG